MQHLLRRLTLPTRAATLVLVAAAITAPGAAAAPTERTHTPDMVRAASREVAVYFTRGEHFARLTRAAGDEASPEVALRGLFAGPSRREQRRGIRTSIPRTAKLHDVSLADGIVTIDVSQEFSRGPSRSIQVRLAQVVYTATAHERVAAVRIAIDGRPLTELAGFALDPPVTRAAFAPVAMGGPPAAPVPPAPSALVRSIQQRMIELSYLPADAADGIAGPQTRHAILAFQGWEGLPRDGRATNALKRRLDASRRPLPPRGASRRIDVSLSRQVALLVQRGRTLRTIHVSTGKPSSPTPPGRFRVFRKELMSWSVPFRVWLPYASYFNRGIAFHESAEVPPHPASAGCVRIPASDSRRVYDFARIGTPVNVRRR